MESETDLPALLSQALSAEAAPALARNLGETESAVHRGFDAFVPALLGGLMAKSATPMGAANVFSIVTSPNVDPGLIGNLSSLLGSGQSSNLIGVGKSLLASLFGAERTAGIGAALAGSTGLRPGSAANLAMMAAPLVLSYIKTLIAERGIDAADLASLLAAQKEHLAGMLDPALTAAFGAETSRGAAATGSATVARSSRWLPWLIGALLSAGVLLYFFGRTPLPPRQATTSLPATTFGQFPAKVYFESGKADIGPEGEAAIRWVAALMADDRSIKVEVTGYTDKTGDSVANQELAKNRALAVKTALAAAGVNADRIDTKPPVFVEVGESGGDRASAPG